MNTPKLQTKSSNQGYLLTNEINHGPIINFILPTGINKFVKTWGKKHFIFYENGDKMVE
jgi:hypothetical protein